MPALQTHAWFAGCEPAFQQALLERARLRVMVAGESVFTLGAEPLDGLFCVVAGAMRLGTVRARDGQMRLTQYLEPYQWFGEIGLLDRLPRGQDAIADIDSTVLVVPRPALEAWLDAHPHQWRDLARLACVHTRQVFTLIEDAASTTAQQVVHRLLFAATGFGQTAHPVVRRHVRMPQDYLARMLGVSRQTVNKVLRDLARDGVLALHYGEIEVRDLPALVASAGELRAPIEDFLASAAQR